MFVALTILKKLSKLRFMSLCHTFSVFKKYIYKKTKALCVFE